MDGLIRELETTLSGLKRPMVCFSGGLDSTVLARNVLEFCDDPVLLFVRLPMNTERQADAAVRIAEYLGADMIIAELGWKDLTGVAENGPDRCYHCKIAIYSKALELAKDIGSDAVLAGDNADDLDSERPGHRAAIELGIRNPLKEAGIRKRRVIEAIDSMDIPVPMFKDTCMATRYPVGTPIGEKEMRFAEGCESAVRKVSGLKQLRVRISGQKATVSTDSSELDEMVRHRTVITYELKSRGLDCDLDLRPYDKG